MHEEETENKMLSRKLRGFRGLNEDDKNQEWKLEIKIIYNGIKKSSRVSEERSKQ